MNDQIDPLQEQELISILLKSKSISLVLEQALTLDLPNWYLGAGAIAQTFWNYRSGFDPDYGIGDYDLVYFSAHMDEKDEANLKSRAKDLFGSLKVDLVNQANVHLWYWKEFGKDILPYTSTESAIDTWPTTVTSIGIRMLPDGSLDVYAPFGLDDLFSFTVRPNKKIITEDLYRSKTYKWSKHWKLNIVPWNGT